MHEIRPGLWRWTTPHPAWQPTDDRPDGWGRMVGSLYYEPGGPNTDPIVLIDPLAPAEGTEEGERFWQALDRDVRRRGRPVAVLLGNEFHTRSAKAVYDRYRNEAGTLVWGHPTTCARLPGVETVAVTRRATLAGGVEAYPIRGLGESEIAFRIVSHHAVVFADAVMGTGEGGLRVAPESWAPKTPEGAERYRREFRASLGELLIPPIDMILVSHGEPVLDAGFDALTAALLAPALGD